MHWARLYTVHTFLAGVAGGAAIFLFAHSENSATVALILACLTASVNGSVFAYAYHPPALYALVGPMFAGATIRLIALGSFAYVMLGIASGIYGAMMIVFVGSRRARSTTARRYVSGMPLCSKLSK